GSFSDATFFAGYNFLRTRANLGIAMEQVPFYRYLGGDIFPLPIDGQNQQVVANVFERDVIRTVQGVMSYPFSTFRRIELGASATYIKRDVLFRGYALASGHPVDEDQRLFDATFFQPVAALVFDNSLFGWTGPIYGRRYRLQASRTLGEYSFTEL